MNKSYTIFISFVVALGGFLLRFDGAVISGALGGINEYFSTTVYEFGFSKGCQLAGAIW